jgi:hypothetical protein
MEPPDPAPVGWRSAQSSHEMDERVETISLMVIGAGR